MVGGISVNQVSVMGSPKKTENSKKNYVQITTNEIKILSE